MKYLVLGCDPVGDRPLWEENESYGSAMPVILPPELVADMLAWNEQMAAARSYGGDQCSHAPKCKW